MLIFYKIFLLYLLSVSSLINWVFRPQQTKLKLSNIQHYAGRKWACLVSAGYKGIITWYSSLSIVCVSCLHYYWCVKVVSIHSDWSTRWKTGFWLVDTMKFLVDTMKYLILIGCTGCPGWDLVVDIMVSSLIARPRPQPHLPHHCHQEQEGQGLQELAHRLPGHCLCSWYSRCDQDHPQHHHQPPLHLWVQDCLLQCWNISHNLSCSSHHYDG